MLPTTSIKRPDLGPSSGRFGIDLGSIWVPVLGPISNRFWASSEGLPDPSLLSTTRKDLHGGGGVARPAGVLDPPPPWFTTGAGRV